MERLSAADIRDGEGDGPAVLRLADIHPVLPLAADQGEDALQRPGPPLPHRRGQLVLKAAGDLPPRSGKGVPGLPLVLLGEDMAGAAQRFHRLHQLEVVHQFLALEGGA